MEAKILDSRKRKRIQYHCPTNPQFFQPLLPGFSTNFSIPSSFNQYIQQGSHKTAKLIDKKGKSWDIKVVIVDEDDGDRHYFKDGWGDFCKEHDLKVGDFLVFKHHGNFVFDVSIFDPPTACERDLVLSSSDEDENDDQEEAQMKDYSSSDDDQERNKGLDLEETTGDKNECTKRKTAFKSTTHPYFECVLKSHNHDYGKIYIPLDFREANGLSKRWCEMALIDEKGRSWPMQLRHYRSTTGRAPYIGGWRPFDKANGFNTGDHVFFELIDSGEKPVMKCYNLDLDLDLELDLEETMGDKKECARTKTAFKPTTLPYFEYVLKANSFKSTKIYIPIDFAKANGMSKRWCEMVGIDEKGRQWPMYLRHFKLTGACPYISGWRSFHIANGLKVGDPVVFELIHSGETPVMKLYTSRQECPVSDSRAEITDLSSDHPTKHDTIKNTKGFNRGGGDKVEDCSEGTLPLISTSGYPYCQMVVKPSWSHGMFLPVEFARENGLTDKTCEVVIIDEKKRSWTLFLKNHIDSRLKSAYITGWASFSQANAVNIGDTVVFELVDRKGPVMKFYTINNIS